MSPPASRTLTARQLAVLERIDRRVPIKVIAQELGVSETRVNQHIRALKDIFQAGSLGELVENYRSTIAPDDATAAPALPLGRSGDEDFLKDFSSAAYSKKQVNPEAGDGDFAGRDDPGYLVMSDAMPLIDRAPWLKPGEPRVVPGALDGEHAVLFRLMAVVGIASGILAAVVLVVTAAVTLSEATDGKASIPAAEQQGTG